MIGAVSPDSLIRSMRGHLDRLKTLCSGNGQAIAHVNGIEGSLAELVRTRAAPAAGRHQRDHSHLKPHGRHLSTAGQTAVFASFWAGRSNRRIAVEVGISERAVQNLRRQWQKLAARAQGQAP